jgi:hypothetical protein
MKRPVWAGGLVLLALGALTTAGVVWIAVQVAAYALGRFLFG